MSAAPSTSKTADLKANGEVSRMRSHKGNIPSLPQTKECGLCPAKFTRTTHLNRHLRSHTNERLHHCDVCQSQFTRSDLLTRHKRTCGDSLNVNRSRRKSCQACAESKIKCDLQLPCSKCASRGRDCVFVNDPETSRSKKFAASLRAAAAAASHNSSGTNSPSPAAVDIQLPFFSDLNDLSVPGFQPPMFNDRSSPSSSHSSPLSDNVPRDYIGNAYEYDQDALMLDNHLSRLFTSNLLDPFAMAASSTPSMVQYSPHISAIMAEVPWTDPNVFLPHNREYPEDCTVPTPFSGLNYTEQFPDPVGHSNISIDNAGSSTMNHPSASPSLLRRPFAPFTATPSDKIRDPSPSELQHFLFLFFTVFSKQVPLIHVATWKMLDKPPILIRAMQACGALFIKTPTAIKFVTDTVTSTRDIVVQEFAKYPVDSTEQFNMILAVILLQSIGLFHQNSDLRVSSNVYHGMLVMMIRRTNLISRISAWNVPNVSDISNADTAWRDWANYETIKRSLMLAYFHDCANCMYFSLSPSFQPCEFNICLPSDGFIWNATSAGEWFALVQTPSPYGTGTDRLLSVKMKKAITFLAAPNATTSLPPVLSPFGHFILIHTILRNIHACRSDTIPDSVHIVHDADGNPMDPLASQNSLQNWLQSWLKSPESVQLAAGDDEPPFICNSLPFYWLAQVTLLDVQEGTSLLSSKSNCSKKDDRFQLMKHWLEHIREFLRNGGLMPSDLWEKLMEIRVKLSKKGCDDVEQSDGLLEFFPGA